MEETVKQDVTEGTEKTFTQAEVDKVIGERLKREREKYADYDAIKAKADKFDQMEEASKSELQKAIESRDALQTELDALKNANSIRDIRLKVASETGVPVHLLTAETEEDCKEQANSILDFKTPRNYPFVRDGGEIQTPVGKKSTRDQFAEWSEQVF